MRTAAEEALRLKAKAYDSLRTHAYRELPPAGGPPTAFHLTTRTPEYQAVHSNAFTEGMAPAIAEATQQLQRAMVAGDVSSQQMRRIMDGVARTRTTVKFADLQRQAELDEALGQTWSPDLLRRAQSHAQGYGRTLDPTDTRGAMMDTIMLNPNTRHRAYYDRAARALEARGGEIVPYVKLGDDVMPQGTPLNQVLSGRSDQVPLPAQYDGFLIMHPKHNVATQISDHAMGMYARVLNDPHMSEASAMDVLARANFLMMHGTPYQLGTPAIVESMNDAVMRARFGKTFPQKKNRRRTLPGSTVSASRGRRNGRLRQTLQGLLGVAGPLSAGREMRSA